MNQDDEQLNLLAIFHYIVGGLTILFGSVFLIHVGMGIAMLHGAFGGKDPMDRSGGWLFIIIGSIVVLLGWTLGILTIISGRKLRRRLSRMFCLVIAAIQCINQPFGTILGVFTIVALMRPSVIALFDAGGQTANTISTN